jgi:serine-type D-Ala-D-Ala carboxypeptidase (penicillin-binding protein 5/6)
MTRWWWMVMGAVSCIAAVSARAVPGASATTAPQVRIGGQAVGGPTGGAEAKTSSTYRSAILVDAASGTVLFESDAHRQAPPASMTKLMLILLVAERVRDGRLRWDQPVVSSTLASNIGGSQVYLKSGEVFPLGEMMQAIVIHSANDAATAVAEAVAGSPEAFVALMNERAKQLGMQDTVYRSVHGLPPGKGQQPDLSSAYDMAIVAREVVKFPDILRWSGTKEAPFRGGAMTLTNTNRLVRETTYVDGLKTGYYREAGFNVTATANRDGLRLIAVVMGAPEKRECFGQAAKLLNHGFVDFRAQPAVRQGDTVASDVAVKGGTPRFVRIIAGGDVNVLAKRGEQRKFSVELALAGDVRAPLKARDPVGEIIVKDGDVVVGRVPALAAEPAAQQTSLWERLF